MNTLYIVSYTKFSVSTSFFCVCLRTDDYDEGHMACQKLLFQFPEIRETSQKTEVDIFNNCKLTLKFLYWVIIKTNELYKI